jgi:hypothetical protein
MAFQGNFIKDSYVTGILHMQALCVHSDLMVKWIGEIGRERVGGLVTDNAANIRKGRELTVATDGFTHIFQMR